MKKSAALLLAMIILVSALCGCSKNGLNEIKIAFPGIEEPQSGYFIHSNLADEDSLSAVISLLEKAGVSEERVKVFGDSVQFFNNSIDKSLLTNGFEATDFSEEFYDPYALQDMWLEKNPDFSGYNCRITAFSLFGDYVDIAENAEIRDSELFIDKESLEIKPDALFSENDMERFCALFSVVPTENTKDITVHAEKIIEDFKSRGISFKENDNMSLITMWQHNQWSENENELFVGHTGVLIHCGDGYVFVEKLAFQEPYQVIKFSEKSELNDYLMNKYNISWGQPTADPFVMENDHLLISES